MACRPASVCRSRCDVPGQGACGNRPSPIRLLRSEPMKLKYLCLTLGLAAAVLWAPLALNAQAPPTIKIGILHSLSGTMAISETTLKDTMLMLIDEQNKK